MDSIKNEIFKRFNLYLRILIRRRYIVYLAVFAPLVFTLVFTSIATSIYESEAILLPSEGSTDVGVLGILVGVLGKSGATSEGIPASFLYVDILKSRSILENVLSAEYEYYKNNKLVREDLYSILNLNRNYEGYESFKDKLTVKSDFETGIITVRAMAPGPKIAHQVVNNMIIELDNFNKNIRITRAKTNLEYLEKRIKDAYIEYQAIQDTFVEFQKSNRGYPAIRNPEVQARAEKLEIRKENKRKIYQALYEEYEMARLTKAKKTPIVSVLDSASVPVEKSYPKKIPTFLLSLIFALFIAFFWIMFLEANDPTAIEKTITWPEIVYPLKTDLNKLGAIFRRKR